MFIERHNFSRQDRRSASGEVSNSQKLQSAIVKGLLAVSRPHRSGLLADPRDVSVTNFFAVVLFPKLWS